MNIWNTLKCFTTGHKPIVIKSVGVTMGNAEIYNCSCCGRYGLFNKELGMGYWVSDIKTLPPYAQTIIALYEEQVNV